jgi:hypothetical protein
MYENKKPEFHKNLKLMTGKDANNILYKIFLRDKIQPKSKSILT